MAALLGCAWYLVFKWNALDYPYNNPYPSPNGEYYITRHQTVWERLWRTYPDQYGTARLYEKTGKLLYEGKTRFGDGAGPHWFPGFDGDPHPKPKVFMSEDDDGQYWNYELPTSPGRDE
ncbi:hypothetical protein QTH90_24015 [Variovorax sp. J2P1-59]|uniref:hypothetical protein n=1 Tax=Variovorax flavidus TaxID=3053501 RepID=UPI00257832C4|nr:hypothetical protein [Variovorax sp. J2P1-59]MDM0077493.1 hypothetical protein [Variovorax sp. J2P1-59]